MEIDLLYLPDCPHRHLARRHLDLALARTQLAALVREREVCSSREAARLGMRGSPTILIDGHDPFADQDEPAGLSCRLYRSGASLTGAPTVSQLVDALGT
jgi:hypothetical protein